MPRVPNTSDRAESSRSAQFRFQAKNGFLTYPKCPVTPDLILTHLLNILNTFSPNYILVASEKHADGSPHLHAMFQCNKRVSIKRHNFFDFSVQEGVRKTYHPNIQKLISPKASYDYIRKDGNFVESGEFNDKRSSPDTTVKANTIWARILAESNDKDTFLSRVRADRPQDFVLRWPAVSAFAEAHFQAQPDLYTPRWHDFPGLPDTVRQWAADNVLLVSRWTTNYVLCNDCAPQVYDDDSLIRGSFFLDRVPSDLESNSFRNQTSRAGGDSPSTSVARPEQGRPNGPEA
ncbi:C1 [Paper mulberry leaf curling associated virus 1]|uniref:Replication-associated protein n=1 Tax=Paper mulberry leaf curling associated virus 1 TaxID=2738469 RepID=A0A6M6DQG8_9GEMI|nr:C1 [Paper mulberry leaf curling associated virus 1]QJX74409.1 C1 [Paper mulberry leaf curling associated virus 1]QJX74414.1 C1 [Paper mulberry leaf curling associated virus 1]